MGLLQKLLSTLGLRNSDSRRRRERRGERGGDRRRGDTRVTVEHEPNAGSENAVKGTGGVAADTTAAGSTGTVTDTENAQPGATEPSEAAGTAAGDLDEDVDDATSVDEEQDLETAASAEDDGDGSAAAGNDESPDVLNGIGPAYAERLENAGVDTVADLASADAAELAEETGLGEGRIGNWIEQAREY